MKLSRSLPLVAFALLAPLTGLSQTFTNAGGDLLYQNPLNWSFGKVPNGADSTMQVSINPNLNVVFSSNDTFVSNHRLLMGTNVNSSSLLINGGGTLSFVSDSFANASYVGVSGGTASLTIENGTLRTTKAAASTYAGDGAFHIGTNAVNSSGSVTVKSQGTLEVAGNLGMAMNVGDGAITSKLHVLGGNVTIGNTFFLGNSKSAGEKNIELIVSSGSTFVANTTQIGGANGYSEYNASANIKLQITDGTFNALNFGALSMTNTDSNKLTIDFQQSDPGLFTVGQKIDLITYSSITGAKEFVGIGTEQTSGDISYIITRDTANRKYVAEIVGNSAIPEPSTYALIAGSVALGLVMLRRRKKK